MLSKRVRRTCYLTVTGLLVFFAACAPAVKPATTAPPPVQPQPTAKNEWVIITAEEAENLNPHTMSTLGSEMMNRNVLEPLLDFQGPDLALTPKLAESWEVQPDNLTWVFHLRKGVKFTNGEDFNADAVKFSFDLYSLKESKRYNYIGMLVKETKVIDPYTVHLVMMQPSPIALQSVNQLTILPPAYYKKVGDAEFGKAPVGTGPYKLVEWKKGEQMVFERNKEYWGPKPTPDRLVVRPIKEASTRVAELLAGRADIIAGLPLEQVGDITAKKELAVQPVKGARQMVFPFYQTKKPFTDVKVRTAVNLAVDRASIVKDILQGYGTALRGPNFAPGTLGYDASVPEYPYDPTQAKKLLAEAGYPDGFTANWHVSQGAFVKDMEISEAIAGQLAKIGVKLNLIVNERPKLVASFMEGDFPEMTSTTWGTIQDPDVWLSWNMVNRKSFTDKTAIDMLMESKVTLDPDKRNALFQKLFRYLHDNPVWLYVVATDDLYAARQDTGWKPYALRGDLGYTYYYVPGTASK